MLKLLFAALMLVLNVPASAADPAGTVKIAKGSVSVTRGAEKLPATAGMVVLASDIIVTGADSSVGITLRDNTLLSAGPNATLVLDKFAFDPTTHAGTINASIKRGTLAVVSGKIAKQSPDAVQFRTPNAILGVRGTEFVVDAGSGEK